MTTMIPTADELRGFLTGALSSERFAAVDAWLATLTPAAAEAALAGLVDDPLLTVDRASSGLEVPTREFAAVRSARRAQVSAHLGSGGMAEVSAAHDQVLDRDLAIKVLKARQPGEDLAAYQLRAAAFRREAAFTAALDHPAIPPVYDIGTMAGQPAFTMKRLVGRSLAEVVAEQPAALRDHIQVLARVAEAVAFAHAHGIVHRDLTPANVLVGAFGAVYVLDWGVAARVGSAAGVRAGTPAWMAPEQTTAAAADPRMDVWSLGMLLQFVLRGGQPPGASEDERDGGGSNRSLPRGLVAVAERCVQLDPAHRYGDAAAVAADLHRWLDHGLTSAQDAGWLVTAWTRMQRNPRLRAALFVALIASAVIPVILISEEATLRRQTEARIAALSAAVNLEQAESLAVANAEVQALRQRWPRLPALVALEARLLAARDVAAAQQRSTLARLRLEQLLAHTRQLGPWTDQVQAWRSALHSAGLTLLPANHKADVAVLRRAELAPLQAAALAFLWRAEREQSSATAALPLMQLVAAGGPTPGWQALGRLLPRMAFRAHDPEFSTGPDAETVLVDPEPAAVALALFAPEPHLTAYARSRIATSPGDFWALIAAARAALMANDYPTAKSLALIASGVEPDSLLPQTVLAYAALRTNDRDNFHAAVARAVQIAPNNSEVMTLHAVALAGNGQRAAAQQVIDQISAGHLQFHLSHRVGHPMELAVDAVVAAGLRIASAVPDIGPLAPPTATVPEIANEPPHHH